MRDHISCAPLHMTAPSKDVRAERGIMEEVGYREASASKKTPALSNLYNLFDSMSSNV